MSEVAATDLRVVMQHVGSVLSFVEQKYPPLQNVAFGSSGHFKFAVNHSLKHMAKTTGALAAVCEAVDHGGTMDIAKLREAAVKMTITALNLAHVLGMSAEDLREAIYKEVK